MSRKKNRKKQKAELQDVRPKGDSRAALALRIVATDSTFRIVSKEAVLSHEIPICYWRGGCIHCNTKLYVAMDGETDATIEHIFPLAAGGSSSDLKNLALACSGCNNEMGIRHDARKLDQRAKEVVSNLLERRAKRWREKHAFGEHSDE